MLEAEKIVTMWPTNDLIPLHEKKQGYGGAAPII